MKKMLPVLGLLMMVFLPAIGNAKPFCGGKHFYNDKCWWISRAVSGAANAVDAYSTVPFAHPGVVDNFAFFNVTNKTRVAEAGLVSFGLSTAFSLAEWRVGQGINGKARYLAYVISPATDIALHTYGIVGNYRLLGQCHAAGLNCN